MRLKSSQYQIKSPYILSIRVINSGKRAIIASEYDSPITVTFRDAQILTGRISSASSSHINPQLDVQLHLQDDAVVVEAKPSLLNSKEWFDVQIIADGKPERVRVHSRFPDQTRPMREVEPSILPTMLGSVLVPVLLTFSLPWHGSKK